MQTLNHVLNQLILAYLCQIECYTNKYQKHKPISFCFCVKCFDDTIYQPRMVTYTAKSNYDDVRWKFVDKLQEIVQEIHTERKMV